MSDFASLITLVVRGIAEVGKVGAILLDRVDALASKYMVMLHAELSHPCW